MTTITLVRRTRWNHFGKCRTAYAFFSLLVIVITVAQYNLVSDSMRGYYASLLLSLDPPATETSNPNNNDKTTTIVADKDDDNKNSNSNVCSNFQKLHIVFSTGCSVSQNWQSYVFFYHAMLVKQSGDITRIVSGCTDEEQRIYARRHEEEIVQKMSQRFHIHFAPDYTDINPVGQYRFFNKPFGVRHWMEHVLGYYTSNNSASSSSSAAGQNSKHDDTIIAVFDPDMILLKPFVNNFDGFPLHGWYKTDPPAGLNASLTCVLHSNPIAQQYYYRDDWIKSVGTHMSEVLGSHDNSSNSAAHNVSYNDATNVFSLGSPYILTARDMYAVSLLWSEFTLRVFTVYPHHIAEMYGYSVAIAHLQLRHQLAFQMMVGAPEFDFEGWDFLDGVAPEHVCQSGYIKNLPLLIHYCQEYGVDMLVFYKTRVPDDPLSCEAPLLVQPRKDLAAVGYTHHRLWDGTMRAFQDSKEMIRVSFVLCALTERLNQAAIFFKQHHCDHRANFNATFSFYPLNASILET